MSDEETEEEWWKPSLLDLLDILKRKVETGEICGMMVFAELSREDTTLSWRRGCPPSAPSILTLRHYVREAEENFLDRSYTDGDGDKPMLKVTKD